MNNNNTLNKNMNYLFSKIIKINKIDFNFYYKRIIYFILFKFQEYYEKYSLHKNV